MKSIHSNRSPAPLTWHFDDKGFHARHAQQTLLGDLVVGWQSDGGWKPSGPLEIVTSGIAWRDRIGAGISHTAQCRLGNLTGQLTLIEYTCGWLGTQLALTNETQRPLTLGLYAPLMTHPQTGFIGLTGRPAEWRVYVDSGGCGGQCASYALMDNAGRNEAQGLAVLWSPQGDQSLAIGSVEIERSLTHVTCEFGKTYTKDMSGVPKFYWANADRARLFIRQDAQGYRLDSGETLTLDQTLLILNPDPFQALESFADAMVTFNQVQPFTEEDAWIGWMTWYNQDSFLRGDFKPRKFEQASEAETRRQCSFIRDSGLAAYGIRDIEIDDGYQYEGHLGDWLEEPAPVFPSGMQKLAADLAEQGFRPGIWLTPLVATEDSRVFREHPEWFVRSRETGEPFHLWDWYQVHPQVRAYEIDPTAPGAMEWIGHVFSTLQKWGYRFSKNDFCDRSLHSEGKRYQDQKLTGLMRWRQTWRRIREAVGGQGHALQLCGANNLSLIGIVDNVRTGLDVLPGASASNWERIKNYSATQNINRWWQNGRFFVTDPDSLQVAEYKEHRTYRNCEEFHHTQALSLEEARVRTAIHAACAGNIILGDRLDLLEPERLDICRKILPRCGIGAVPLDMFERTIPRLLCHHIEKPWGSWKVLSVINYEESTEVTEIPLSKLGLDAEECIAWEFWSGEEVIIQPTGLLRINIPPHAVKTIRITPVPENRPYLVGTSFHLLMGAVEIARHNMDKDNILQVTVMRPGQEIGSCHFWTPEKSRIVQAEIQAGPKGTRITINPEGEIL